MSEIDTILKEKRISKNDIQIWGGEVKENELEQFIKEWDFSNMPFVIIETYKEIAITKISDHINIAPEIIERIRIFGEGGDLDLRRDTISFKWRYIGNNKLPSNIAGENFWKENPDSKFFLEEKESFLWGKYNQNLKWHDNRVARAKLSYPINGNPERVKICYKIFSERGNISFVWFTGLKGGTENE